MQFSDALDLYQKTNIFIRLNTEFLQQICIKSSYLLKRTLSNDFI